MENVILVDFKLPEIWEFKSALEASSNKKWQVKACVSNKNHGGAIQSLIRYFKYAFFSFKIFLGRRKYNSVLAWQQFYGLFLTFYCRLFKVKKYPEISVMTFIYKPKKSFAGKIYDKFIRYIVTSGYIKQFIVFSQNEAKYYADLFSLDESLFKAEKLGIEDLSDKFNIEKCDELYISAGRSNRDYKFLRNAWCEDYRKLEIICDTCTDTDTENISYLKDCHEDNYLKRLSESFAVVIPLFDKNISSGQLVILQAMMLKKPVIITENNTAADYIQNGVDGIIIEKTEDALSKALESLENKEFYDYISNNAREKFEKEFSLASLGHSIGKLL